VSSTIEVAVVGDAVVLLRMVYLILQQ